MNLYPPKVYVRFRSPKNAGKIQNVDAVGAAASFQCGSFVRFFLDIENKSGVINRAKFQTNGCGFMIAAADAASEMLAGRQITDLHGLVDSEVEWLPADLAAEFPFSRKQCAEIVFNAVREALANYRLCRVEEFRGERELLCTCFGVAVDTVEKYIAANSPFSVENVTEECRAGGGCGSCRMLIQEMIDNNNSETGTVLSRNDSETARNDF